MELVRDLDQVMEVAQILDKELGKGLSQGLELVQEAVKVVGEGKVKAPEEVMVLAPVGKRVLVKG